jgi:predicted nucleotidyltransferase
MFAQMDDVIPTNSNVARRQPDFDTERATRSFLRRLAERYSVREAILFGSRARQAHRPDSDADLAVVLEGEHGNRVAAALDMLPSM